ncbi:MAG: hypothetical protein ACTSUV_01070 [Candidatus Ranarchaeia archaeon]
MTSGTFVEYTPLVSVKGTSFKAQVGKVNGIWYLKVTRGIKVILFQKLDFLDPDEITVSINNSINMPGFSEYYANLAAAKLLEFIKEGQGPIVIEKPVDYTQELVQETPNQEEESALESDETKEPKETEELKEPEEPEVEDVERKFQPTIMSELGLPTAGLIKIPDDEEEDEPEEVVFESSDPRVKEMMDVNIEDFGLYYIFSTPFYVATEYIFRMEGKNGLAKYWENIINKIFQTWEIISDESEDKIMSRLVQWIIDSGINVETKNVDPASVCVVIQKGSLKDDYKIPNEVPCNLLESLFTKISKSSDLKVTFESDELNCELVFTPKNLD